MTVWGHIYEKHCCTTDIACCHTFDVVTSVDVTAGPFGEIEE